MFSKSVVVKSEASELFDGIIIIGGIVFTIFIAYPLFVFLPFLLLKSKEGKLKKVKPELFNLNIKPIKEINDAKFKSLIIPFVLLVVMYVISVIKTNDFYSIYTAPMFYGVVGIIIVGFYYYFEGYSSVKELEGYSEVVEELEKKIEEFNDFVKGAKIQLKRGSKEYFDTLKNEFKYFEEDLNTILLKQLEMEVVDDFVNNYVNPLLKKIKEDNRIGE